MNNKPWISIFGANSDIAIEVARIYASNGYNLYLLSRNVSSLQRIKADLQIRFEVNVEIYHFDATDFKKNSEIYDILPTKPIGVIIAFGVMFDQKSTQDSIKLIELTVETNFLGSITILETIAKDFEARKEGFIVGISSVAGERGRQSNYIYGSTKGAFSIYLEGLRHRLYKSNVRVITVKPGFVNTKMTENLKLPFILTASPVYVAKKIFYAVEKNKKTVYIKSIWRYIMLTIKLIPDFLFNRTSL